MAAMIANTKVFDQYKGEDIYEYSLTNKNGVTLSTLSWGANWYELLVPTKAGKKQNLLLNFPHTADYAEKNPYLCMSIGRTAGRIGGASFTINGKTYNVDVNESDYNLHGGFHGFNFYTWNGKIQDNHIIFNKKVTNELDNFPGNMDVTITYTLTDDDEVIIDYAAETDADSLFNPTNHAYWNLNAGDDPVTNHELYIHSSHRAALNSNKIPTGELAPVLNTPYDFSKNAPLGKAIAALQSIPEKGLDDVFIIDDHDPAKPVAELRNPDNGISVTIFSERNAIVSYTANGWDDSQKFIDKTGQPQVAIALESQTAPNAVSDLKFGDISIEPGEIKHYYTKYKFGY